MCYLYYDKLLRNFFVYWSNKVWEHKNKVVKGFTEKYNVNKLVYYELTDSIETAINREKQLKRWHREWKINLIKEMNPEFKDLSLDWE